MYRVANDTDAVAVRDLERAASLAALAHVYPPERYPYPDDDVLARWTIVLADPGCTTLVTGDPPIGVVTVDATTVRHLAVHPDHWGEGLGRSLLAAACARVDGPVRLWCLVENHRARRLYEHLGWVDTGARQEATWPPYPLEMEYRLDR